MTHIPGTHIDIIAGHVHVKKLQVEDILKFYSY